MNQNTAILRPKEVAKRLGLSVALVWNKANPKNRHYDAAFPKPFKISANATGFLESEVIAYIQHLAAQRADHSTTEQGSQA